MESSSTAPPNKDDQQADGQASPVPEALTVQSDDDDTSVTSEGATPAATAVAGLNRRSRRASYRPSHKATFIGLAVVVAILAINAGIITFIIKKQSKAAATQASQQDQVTINQGALDKLGVNRSAIGDAGVELTVNPNARFKGAVQVGGDVSIAGQLKLNSKFSATDASLAKLEAGNTSLNQLDVNGDGTVSNLTLRKDLVVTGLSRLQGAVTVSQIFTVNNNANVSGSLSVGGALTVNSFHTSSLVVDTSLTVGGHIITRGAAPSVAPGTALGANGTVSISGNDTSGTVAANIGTGAVSGIVANIAFINNYSNIPHVVVTAVGAGIGSVYINRSLGGFSIGVNGAMAPGGYAFDYIVEQ